MVIFKEPTALESPGTGVKLQVPGQLPTPTESITYGNVGLQAPCMNLTHFKFGEALVKAKCCVFSSLSIVMRVDLYLVIGHPLCFQAFWLQAMKLLL